MDGKLFMRARELRSKAQGELGVGEKGYICRKRGGGWNRWKDVDWNIDEEVMKSSEGGYNMAPIEMKFLGGGTDGFFRVAAPV